MIAIHRRSGSFSDTWIRYCEENAISYKLVDCFSSNIVEQLRGCRGLLWHWPHWDPVAALFARQLTLALEMSGIRVFPSSAASWHYDDKVGQKYLFEALGLPHMPASVAYTRNKADAQLREVSFPMVFKLRNGAGSSNVLLVKSRRQGKRLVRKAFGWGFRRFDRFYTLRESIRKFDSRRLLESGRRLAKGVALAVAPSAFAADAGRERGYVYFQSFAPGNDCDIRVIVIGSRAFAIRRQVRPGEFRASGSGIVSTHPESIPLEAVKLAHQSAQRMRSECVAFDFVCSEGEWRIIEVSYAFTSDVYRSCPGFWDADLNWHEGSFVPEEFMLTDLLESIERDASRPCRE